MSRKASDQIGETYNPLGRGKDLTNQKFGRLTAIKPTSDRDRDGSIIWLCECECGNLVKKAARSLSKGDVRSCGCLFFEKASSGMKKINSENHIYAVEGTDIRMINQKLAKNNSSGCKGVTWRKNRGTWAAHITFQGQRYWLGTYRNIEDAVQARKAAEEKLHGGFLAWFQEAYPQRYAKMEKNGHEDTQRDLDH